MDEGINKVIFGERQVDVGTNKGSVRQEKHIFFPGAPRTLSCSCFLITHIRFIPASPCISPSYIIIYCQYPQNRGRSRSNKYGGGKEKGGQGDNGHYVRGERDLRGSNDGGKGG